MRGAPRDGCDGCDGSLMRDHYGLAQRTSDDGTLMYAPIHPAIPKLSLWRPQAQALEQELGQASRRRPLRVGTQIRHWI